MDIKYLWESERHDLSRKDLNTVTTLKSFNREYCKVTVSQIQTLNIHNNAKGQLELNVSGQYLQPIVVHKH